jgi:mono/diheme cytochrome c family protein
MFCIDRCTLVRGLLTLGLVSLGVWAGVSLGPRSAASAALLTADDRSLDKEFSGRIQPFVQRYCVTCHGAKKPKAGLDLGRTASMVALVKDISTWNLVLERLQAKEMPPATAKVQPNDRERAAVVAWLESVRDREADLHAGDPGIVLARRLSNAELDYTIRDLTHVDIRPARTFPVDPASEAGFDNSGEALAMSPTLFKKYLAAARLVADHIVLKPDGFVFAPHPVTAETDRDKYCVSRIIAFYKRHQVDLADYFLAAWKYRHRAAPSQELSRFATEANLSPVYLALVWAALTEGEADTGPLAAIRNQWADLPASDASTARKGCVRLRDLTLRLRAQLKPQVAPLRVAGISPGSQPLVLWHDRQLAARHRRHEGKAAADLPKLADQARTIDPALERFFSSDIFEPETERRWHMRLNRFCEVLPDAFVVTDRGPYFDPKGAGQGRPLTAGFHLMQGYFRDDGPLVDVILDESQRRELDGLWQELDFITLAPLRQYRDFIFFERAEPPRFMFEADFDFARSEDQDVVSQAKIERLSRAYLAKARQKKASAEALAAIQDYFTDISAAIRRVERARLAAEPSHLRDLLTFAERAYRRPLEDTERTGLLQFYRTLRSKEGLAHEDALRDTVVSILLSPQFCYRVDLAGPGPGVQPLSDYALASRLSYFLWSSMPDAELLASAAAGDLHRPEVLRAQARRMLRDPRARALANEFAGNWLDIRRFEEHNSVDRARFPTFTNDLRQAMFEEPMRYFLDVVQRNRSVLDLLDGRDTFVNGPLARHYGIPNPPAGTETWVHVEDARRFERGGLLPMAVFLTKNAPGLRTSPVKRGYWVVRRLLGERIPPPPPNVPELPKDEAGPGELPLPQLLARHRSDSNCAGCHQHFDAIGLVFEGFGPVGERRTKDLGGRPVQTSALFPDGKERAGLHGLREYLHDRRQDDFVDNLCKKLLGYALGRSLILSDRKALAEMNAVLRANDYAFGSLVETIVTTPQFRNQRGRDDPRTD